MGRWTGLLAAKDVIHEPFLVINADDYYGKAGDLKAEYLLPIIVDQCICNDKAKVRLLETQDKWFGVTYKEDKPVVVAAIRKLI